MRSATISPFNTAEAGITPLRGYLLLDNPLLNKGSAFSEEERREYGLLGLLPFHSSTIDEQLARVYENYRRKDSDVERYIFLTALQDRNETLFYVHWTDGRALVATGSPFEPVTIGGCTITIGQCNNSFIFPGVGLGLIASGAGRVTNEMFAAAALALSELSPALTDDSQPLYPPLERVREIARTVALAVAREAQRSGLGEAQASGKLERGIDAKTWTPRYLGLTGDHH